MDERAVRELGIPGTTLMENAGREAARVIVASLRDLGAVGREVAVVCGKGGNGGDGFVVARHLKRARAGLRPVVYLAFPQNEIVGDAAAKFRQMRAAGVAVRNVDGPRTARALAASACIVDALLGTGARGAPAAPVARWIDRISASGRPVVALDIPSGVSADGGAPAGPAVRATLTVTFAALKRGLVTGEGAALAGRVVVVPIGVPEHEVGRGVSTFVLERGDVAPLFPPRSRDAHKGTFGHLLVVAGSVGKTGAAALAARAALRAGAGLVTAATSASAQPVLAGLLLEAMTEPLPETAARTVGDKARDTVVELAATRDALALGPGLGLDAETQQLVRALARDIERPMVLDADALTALAGRLELVQGARGPRCLTPHPGEMARLLGVSVDEVQRDRVACARRVATAYGVYVALKGAGTVVASPDGIATVNPTGNPGMASGGTGDVLTGIVGALLARALAPAAALRAAVYLHGLAGDVAAERVGEESLVAGDVIDALPEAFRRLRDANDDGRQRVR